MNTEKQLERMASRVVHNVMQNLINEGVIDPYGKTRLEILTEAEEYIAKFKDLKDEDIVFIIDHTVDLLKQARLYRKAGKKELACLFYALYMEHKLNDFMATLGKRKGLSLKEVESLIRDCSYKAKCSWLLRVFGIKSVDNIHADRIFKLMELRNSYVHYKWKPQNEQVLKEMGNLLDQIEKTVKYLQYFEAKHLALVSPGRVSRLLARETNL